MQRASGAAATSSGGVGTTACKMPIFVFYGAARILTHLLPESIARPRCWPGKWRSYLRQIKMFYLHIAIPTIGLRALLDADRMVALPAHQAPHFPT